MTRQLRDYQVEAVSHLRDGFAAGLRRIPMVLATGLGKTEIFTDPSLLDDYLDAGKRVLIIAHTDELIMQAAQKARRNNPKRTVGIVKGQEFNQLHAQIIVSSRQTLGHATGGPRRLRALRNVGLIIVDEAHHAVRSNTYGKILEHFGAFPVPADEKDIKGGVCPGSVHVAGFTATLARGDKAKLSTVWQQDNKRPVFRKDVLFGIRHGYLLDVTGKQIVVPDLDMRNVRQTGGDYQDSALAEELERTYAPEVIAQAYADTCGQNGVYRKGIAFWPLVDTAYHGAKAFNDLGITSEVIHGQLPKAERRAMLHRLHTGETRVIHGVSVLTEGFDEPTVDVCVIARPTRSAPLYQQMVGRVLRPDLTKPPAERGKALVLDVVGAGATHDLRSLIDLAPERKLSAEDIERRSLLELEDDLIGLEQARAGAAIEIQEDVYHGETEVLEFDPLGRAKLWARTPDGNWYMSAGGAGYAFLTPSVAGEPAHWDVVLCSKVSYPRDGVQPWIRATGLVDMPLELALGYAEDLAVEAGGTGSKSLAGRKSAWRKGAPSVAQESFAKRLGVWRDGMTRGECSEAIDAHNAAVRIDPLVAAVRRAYETQANDVD